MQLFCFPHAGGAASAFHPWRTLPDVGLDVAALEYPGRGSRWGGAPAATVRALVEDTAAAVAARAGDSFALFGHSFGALIAAGATQELAARHGRLPDVLFVSAAPAPDVPRREQIHDLPEEAFLARLEQFGGLPAEVIGGAEARALFVPLVRHDMRLLEVDGLDLTGALPAPITAMGGLTDPDVTMSDLIAWSGHTNKSFRTRFYPGGHFYLFENAERVLGDIARDALSMRTGSASSAILGGAR